MSWNDRKNAEGYSDPTAYQALKNIETEEERFHKLLHMIFDICALSDFEIEGRIVLVDKRSGKVWRWVEWVYQDWRRNAKRVRTYPPATISEWRRLDIYHCRKQMLK